MMRRWLLLFSAAALLAGAVRAQPAGGIEGYTTLFISPSGEPYRGHPDEPYPVVFWFKQTDTNHDGAIDLAEFRTDAHGFFDVLDTDHNGYVDGTEVHVYETTMIPDALHTDQFSDAAVLILAQLAGPTGPSGTPNPTTRRRKLGLQGAAPYNLLLETQPITAADADLNGRVTLAEFMAATDRRFKRLDLNGDGKLTLDELPKTAAQVIFEDQTKRRRR